MALSGENDHFLKGLIELDRNITGEATATDDNSSHPKDALGVTRTGSTSDNTSGPSNQNIGFNPFNF